MGVPRVYRKGSTANINYDYTDIAAGTGIETFYGGVMSGAHVLSNNTFYSDKVIEWSENQTGSTMTKVFDLDYDVPFNVPRTLKGKSVINVPMGFRSKAANVYYEIYVNNIIKKWDGTTETTLGTGASLHLSGTNLADGDIKTAMTATEIDVPKNLLKKGDTLRLTVEGYCMSNNGRMIIGNDPQNRATSIWSETDGGAPFDFTFGTDPTNLLFQVPFKIDL